MRKLLPAVLGVAVLSASVYLGAQPQKDHLKVRLRLVDSVTGKSVGGIVRVFAADGKAVPLPGLFDRMAGLIKDLPDVHWYIVPVGGAETMLPRGQLRLHALSGLETDHTQLDLDLRNA